jgi:multidrug efflux system membrane fusion protein
VVNQEQKVEYRSVVLGSHVGQLRVITEGLKADDWVVIEGIQKLMPGFQINAERISLVEPKAEK